MRCAFFEPLNREFFLTVVEALYWGYYETCIRLYHESKDENGEIDDGRLSACIETPEWQKRLSIFNYSLGAFDALAETCRDYETVHIKLLTGDQHEDMCNLLLKTKKMRLDDFSEFEGIRIQRILEDDDAVRLGAAHAHFITEKGDPIGDLGKYVEAAVRFVEETRGTGSVESYAYICSKENSDFDEFKRLTESVPGLENLTPCTNFQRFEKADAGCQSPEAPSSAG
ncbi:MAG: hypothetical protein FWB79_06885 [Treponema sp.]|nr:hypothetical protein [Treponema sp.]